MNMEYSFNPFHHSLFYHLEKSLRASDQQLSESWWKQTRRISWKTSLLALSKALKLFSCLIANFNLKFCLKAFSIILKLCYKSFNEENFAKLEPQFLLVRTEFAFYKTNTQQKALNGLFIYCSGNSDRKKLFGFENLLAATLNIIADDQLSIVKPLDLCICRARYGAVEYARRTWIHNLMLWNDVGS